MAKNLVIVESPAKAKTLKKFLGSSYKIEASVGHVRDLPKSELGIDIENDFEPKYITIRGKGEVLSKLRKEVKAATNVFLATDPDREGEAISWHLMHALKLDGEKTRRITFNEITKNAVKRSIKEARQIDMGLVNAQQARRELDRIVGYKISPLLWKKVKKGLSAGRVQSVCLKMICDREEEIGNFTPEEYWTIDAKLKKGNEQFTARFAGDSGGKLEIKSKAEAEKIVATLNKAKFIVTEVKKGSRTRRALPPFTTSTLQQEASKLLGFATHKTMMIAQQLYEGVEVKGEGTVGLVSYIRTDSTRISDEAFTDVKDFITENYGGIYAVETKAEYKSKKRSQDAHEAIRPTYTRHTPDSVKESLSRDQLRLYRLIWERFVASQMTPATYDTQNIKIAAGECQLRANGSILKFEGFLKVYNKMYKAEDQVAENEDDKESEIKMPELAEGDKLVLAEIDDQQHFTQAPPRYTEANLVKAMEELGIGRPSTYSSTITNIVQRGYVAKENKTFYTTELGEVVNSIMKNNFDNIVNIDFTAKMEDDLDKIEEGRLEWKEVLRQFYQPFDDKLKLAEEQIGHIEVEDEKTDFICENCGRNMVIKLGRYGKFLACPGFPECRNTRPFFESAGVPCPLCAGDVLIKKTKKGRRYYGCDNHPQCEFMSWNKPSGEKCPNCGEPLYEKGTKGILACPNNECGYTKDKDED